MQGPPPHTAPNDGRKKGVRARNLSERYEGMKYPLFFFPEIRALLSEDQAEQYAGELPGGFDEKRRLVKTSLQFAS